MSTTYTVTTVCTGTDPGTGTHPFSGRVVMVGTPHEQDNFTRIQWRFEIYINDNAYQSGFNYGNSIKVNVSLNGQAVYGNSNYGSVQRIAMNGHYSSNPLVLCSGTLDVKHGTDGTKTMNVSASIVVPDLWGATQPNYMQSISPAGAVVLDPITRAAIIETCPDITLHRTNNVNHTITWTDVNDYYYKVQYLYGNTILHTSSAIPENTEEYTWAVPGTVAENEIHSKTMQITVALHTYEDSACTKEIGVSAQKITFTIGNTFAPMMQSLPTYTNIDYVGNACVAGVSTRSINISMNYYAGAEFASAYAVWVDSQDNEVCERAIGSLPLTLNVPPPFTDNYRLYKINFQITDSRGYTFSPVGVGDSVSVLGWISPTIQELTAWRCDSDGTENDRGSYFKVSFTYSIRTLGQNNSKNSKVKYKWLGVQNYTQAASGALSNYSGTITLGPYQLSNPQDEKLEIRVELSDAFTSENPIYIDFTVLPADVFIDIMTAGTRDDKKVALGIGIMADEAETIRSAWKLKLWDTGAELYDDNGTVRASLDYTDGLQFFDSSGNLTKQYPVS